MKRRVWLALVTFLAVFFVGGCGEKPCNRAGSVKAENGKVYHCADRGDGSGLRWYPE